MVQPEDAFQPKSVSDVLVDAFNLFVKDWTQYVLVAALLVIPLTLVDITVNRAFVERRRRCCHHDRRGGRRPGRRHRDADHAARGDRSPRPGGATALAGLDVNVIDGAAYALGTVGGCCG